ncbi:hypothetical protein DFH09DRAFT_1092975 [Mycena vulgaris]|nr:hypothetical protein DFH09DRAFT_1092975 [Mycena vulgaris]
MGAHDAAATTTRYGSDFAYNPHTSAPHRTTRLLSPRPRMPTARIPSPSTPTLSRTPPPHAFAGDASPPMSTAHGPSRTTAATPRTTARERVPRVCSSPPLRTPTTCMPSPTTAASLAHALRDTAVTLRRTGPTRSARARRGWRMERRRDCTVHRNEEGIYGAQDANACAACAEDGEGAEYPRVFVAGRHDEDLDDECAHYADAESAGYAEDVDAEYADEFECGDVATDDGFTVWVDGAEADATYDEYSGSTSDSETLYECDYEYDEQDARRFAVMCGVYAFDGGEGPRPRVFGAGFEAVVDWGGGVRQHSRSTSMPLASSPSFAARAALGPPLLPPQHTRPMRLLPQQQHDAAPAPFHAVDQERAGPHWDFASARCRE